MKIVKPGYEIMTPLVGGAILRHIELCGRVAYKSEWKIAEGSAERFVHYLIGHGHESVLEHYSFSVRFIVDRGVSHELVRHRIASYTQESTRYCSYADGITVIEPRFYGSGTSEHGAWEAACLRAEEFYRSLLSEGCTPQEARTVLPTSTKTEVIMTANLREWRHFLRLRTDKAAHPQIREVAVPLLLELKQLIPVVFDDIEAEPIEPTLCEKSAAIEAYCLGRDCADCLLAAFNERCYGKSANVERNYQIINKEETK